MSDERSDRLALPLLQPGQAQKEMYHNEALALLDCAVQMAVEEPPRADPPAAPEPGQCWVAAAQASGGWLDRDGCVACWTAAGWRFVAPREGMRCWVISERVEMRYDGGEWVGGALRGDRLIIAGTAVVGSQQPAIADPDGGAMTDEGARQAIAMILAALRNHGLIASD